MSKLLIEIILFTAVLLSGFYAGTGFFIAMGGNPAIAKMSDRTFAEYWQHVDHYMGARMIIFGPLLLLFSLLSVLVLLKEWHMPSFWLVLGAFVILVADLVFVFSTNHPLNRLIQTWDLSQLPSNVQEIKWKVVNAFYIRTFFMIGCFIFLLLGVWLRKTA